MRPNHNKNRMRGRHNNNNNRRPSNPLARSYESNGPDVKVRGNPQHIVEKYSQLARDAQVAGDPVLAEAYLQHAEHYYRIISAAHAAMAQAQGFGRPADAEAEEEGEDEDLTGLQQPYPDFRQQQQAMQQRREEAYNSEQPQPEGGPPLPPRQPYQERPPQERPERQNFGERGERPQFNDRGDRPPFNERQDRGERPPFGDRGERQDRGDRQQNFGDRGGGRFPPRGPRQDFRPRRPEPDAEGAEGALPSFITGGAPRPVNGAEPEGPPQAQGAGAPEGGEGDGRFPYRSRRRRRGRDFGPEGEPSSEAGRPEDQPAE